MVTSREIALLKGGAFGVMGVVDMAWLCSCIWGRPDPGPVRLQDMQQVMLDTKRTGMEDVFWHRNSLLGASAV